MADFQLVW